MSQGIIKLWTEIIPTNTDMDSVKVWDISDKPPFKFQLQMVVWDTKDVIAMDSEGTSDIFIKCFFDKKHYKETDTHWRCSTGKGSFNWRMLFDTEYPRHDDDYIMTIQCWDRDILSANDLIGESAIDLQ